MMKEEDLKGFNGYRSVLFPIYRHEIRKLVTLAFLFLLISFCYTVLRSFKDVLMFSNMVDGRKSIYLTKVFVIPSTIIFTFLYTTIAKRVNRDVRFNIVAFFFLFSFLCFTVFAYSKKGLNENLILKSFDSFCTNNLPAWLLKKAATLIEGICKWPISLFYILVETWGSIMLGVTFWTFSNEINSSKQAKRVYPFLMIGAAFGAILAGCFIKVLEKNTYANLLTIVFLIFLIIVIYNILATGIKRNPEKYDVEVKKDKDKKKKVKLSFKDSIILLLKSKYLLTLMCIVLGYNVFVVFIESVWKGTISDYKFFLQKLFETKFGNINELEIKEMIDKDIKNIYFLQNIFVGVMSLFFIVFVSSKTSKKKWIKVALFTPFVAFITSVFFAIAYFSIGSFKEYIIGYKDKIVDNYSEKGAMISFSIVIVGLVVLVLIKSSKYIFFDTSKERAYIPLDEESKVNGKAAIDAIGSRFGKGMASILISLGIDPFIENKKITAIVLFTLSFVVLLLWIMSVFKLSPIYEQKVRENEAKSLDISGISSIDKSGNSDSVSDSSILFDNKLSSSSDSFSSSTSEDSLNND